MRPQPDIAEITILKWDAGYAAYLQWGREIIAEIVLQQSYKAWQDMLQWGAIVLIAEINIHVPPNMIEPTLQWGRDRPRHKKKLFRCKSIRLVNEHFNEASIR